MSAGGPTRGAVAACPLCEADGGRPIWRDAQLRVVVADEPGLPGFLRVIWNAHVAELTDLAPGERQRLMSVVCEVESAIRETLAPDKVNLASFGNMVPHLHWHLVPRWRDDRWWPAPTWATPRDDDAPAGARRVAVEPLLGGLYRAVGRRLDALR